MRHFAAALLLIFLALPSMARADVTIFIYHRFGDQRFPSTNVDIGLFREQMLYLRENGYRVIPLSRVVEALKNGVPLPERAVAITIDDGYRTFYARAWPVLREFGYPFTLFVYPKATDAGWPDYVSWEEVRQLQAAGADIQDHGFGHHRLGNRPQGMDEKAYRDWIRHDLRESARMLTEKLGARPRFLALPYGEYNRTVLEEARNLGYEAVFSQDAGSVSSNTDRFCIPREPILGTDWSTLAHFATVLRRVDLPLAEVHPDIIPFQGLSPARFQARLLHPERYIPGTLGIYVTELGWQKASIAGDVVSIENSKLLKRRLNRVAVSGREKETGRIAIRFWQFLKADSPAGP